ncbi:MAG: hypothetical protein Q4D19_09815 [Lautropia sp.]|nr:hypothetical protein [Lautropia sp.]
MPKGCACRAGQVLIPVLRLALVAALMLAWPLALVLPLWVGWENGLFEKLQLLTLLLGGTLCLIWAFREGRGAPPFVAVSGSVFTLPAYRAFWCACAPIWFILAASEMSWGAVLLQPLSFNAVDGPEFSSTQQLRHRLWVIGAAATALLFSVLLFFRYRLWHPLLRLWQVRQLPRAELGVMVVALVYSAAAEGRVPGVRWHGTHLQTLEEMTELLAFILLLMAQWHVRRALAGVGHGVGIPSGTRAGPGAER